MQQGQGTPGSASGEVRLEGQGARAVKGGAQEAVGAQRGRRSQPGGLGKLPEAGDSDPGLTVERQVSQAQGGTGKRSAPGGRNNPCRSSAGLSLTPAGNWGSWSINSSGEKTVMGGEAGRWGPDCTGPGRALLEDSGSR